MIAKTQVKKATDEVLFAVKTPMLRHAAQSMFPADLPVRDALDHLREKPGKDEMTRSVVDQLNREMSGRHDLIAVGETGEVTCIPGDTLLRDIAVPREIRTRTGLKTVPTAAVEVQAYAPVGSV